jgi:hypothetical protein
MRCENWAMGILNSAEGFPVVVHTKNKLGKQIRASSKLTPSLLVPNFAIASLLLKVLKVAWQKIGDTASHAAARGHKGHLIPALVRVL